MGGPAEASSWSVSVTGGSLKTLWAGVASPPSRPTPARWGPLAEPQRLFLLAGHLKVGRHLLTSVRDVHPALSAEGPVPGPLMEEGCGGL